MFYSRTHNHIKTSYYINISNFNVKQCIPAAWIADTIIHNTTFNLNSSDFNCLLAIGNPEDRESNERKIITWIPVFP